MPSLLVRKKPRIRVVCEQCGKEFEVEPWLRESRRFCGRKCFRAYQAAHPEEFGRKRPRIREEEPAPLRTWESGGITEMPCAKCGNWMEPDRHSDVEALQCLMCGNRVYPRLGNPAGAINKTDTEKEESSMAYKDKKCPQYEKTFAPNGPRQERCDDCRQAGSPSASKKKRAKKKGARTSSRRDEIRALLGEARNGKYTITVDLSVYPEVHKRLLALAREEFRTPEMQLLKMLDEEFRMRELAA